MTNISHAPVSVKANLQGRLCRSQNHIFQNGCLPATVSVEANLQGRLCRSQNHIFQNGCSPATVSVEANVSKANVKRSGRSQNRRLQKGLPA
jgi:hypothetical protein